MRCAYCRPTLGDCALRVGEYPGFANFDHDDTVARRLRVVNLRPTGFVGEREEIRIRRGGGLRFMRRMSLLSVESHLVELIRRNALRLLTPSTSDAADCALRVVSRFKTLP